MAAVTRCSLRTHGSAAQPAGSSATPDTARITPDASGRPRTTARGPLAIFTIGRKNRPPSLRRRAMNRWKAAAAHLLLSILVIGGIAIGAVLLWYPDGLYRVSGLDRILQLMLFIDLAAGPLLTLIIYRKGKRGLTFDLAVIALCQFGFLAYGLHALAQSRPVFLLGQPDQFTLVLADEIAPAALGIAARPEWRKLSWSGPLLAATRMPSDPVGRSRAIEALFAGGAGIEHSPRWYMPYDELAQEIARNARPLGAGQSASSYARATGVPAEHLHWHPVASRNGRGRMLIDARDGRPLQVIRAN
ncbi:hypothetical protein [Luteimonas sp. SDU82]|uniref:hypothetical protein n=1 Tax=Luteimonas sp. SDU82 TaxID=3422592 RepID=UPI003EBC91CD